MYNTATCGSSECSAQIIWAVTPRGKNMPVDAEPSAVGNVLLTGDEGASAPVATVVNPDNPPLGGWPGSLHQSHFATCPAANSFRHRKRK